ncbi:MAG: bestrophin family protein [Microcoleaceae cyanobacterium]
MTNDNWFKSALSLQGSVVRRIMPPVLASMVYAIIVKLIHITFPDVHQPVLGTLIPAIVLSLLLVFRTNTAYDRFWEGRKLIGKILITGRNLSRQLLTGIPDKNSEVSQIQQKVLRLLPAFFWAAVLRLRKEPIDQRLASLLTAEQVQRLEGSSHRPLEIAKWISDHFSQLHQQNFIDTVQLTNYNNLVDQMVDYMTGCERILNTPMPLAYAKHLKHLLILYCLFLPFQIVQELGWASVVATGVTTFALFGIEAIGLEIENPFGYDYNDLPLESIYQRLRDDIEELQSNHGLPTLQLS